MNVLTQTLRRAKSTLENHWQTHELSRHSELGPLLKPGFTFSVRPDREHIESILAWYRMAIEANADGGVPRKINLIEYCRSGKTFYPSYPETTGYILASLITAHRHGYTAVTPEMLHAMAQYLIREQNDDGGYSSFGRKAKLPSLVFDTGQVLCGLTSYLEHIAKDSDVQIAVEKACRWMSEQVEAGGSYAEASSFSGKKCYYARATIGLAHGGILFNQPSWLESAHRNIQWVISNQRPSGWFDLCQVGLDSEASLHGIAYTIQGVLECGVLLKNNGFIESARLAVDAIVRQPYEDLAIANTLPGHFTSDYQDHDQEISPTGTAQFALCCFKLAIQTKDLSYQAHGSRFIEGLKKLHFQGFSDSTLNGLLPGSWPVNGNYQPFDLPNWPIKFFLDGLLIKSGVPATEVDG